MPGLPHGTPAVRRHGVARVLSRLGVCSRSQACQWVAEGRVCFDGRRVHDPEYPLIAGDESRITVDGRPLQAPVYHYRMLNKPRGLVTTAADERGRATIYRCLDDDQARWLAPVGRLDKASEGLLLLSNDSRWAASITDPATGPTKTYHVQVEGVPDAPLLQRIAQGVTVDDERLSAASVSLLRSGTRNAWLEVRLDEGRNRHIRRLLQAFDLPVLRLVRVAIGGLPLGELPKGQWRELTPAEITALAPPTTRT